MKNSQRKAMFAKLKELQKEKNNIDRRFQKVYQDYSVKKKTLSKISNVESKIKEDKKAIFSMKHPHLVSAKEYSKKIGRGIVENAKSDYSRVKEYERKHAPAQKATAKRWGKKIWHFINKP